MITLPVMLVMMLALLFALVPLSGEIYDLAKVLPLPKPFKWFFAHLVISHYRIKRELEKAPGESWRYFVQFDAAIATIILFIFWGENRGPVLLCGLGIIAVLGLPALFEDNSSSAVLGVIGFLAVLGICAALAALLIH